MKLRTGLIGAILLIGALALLPVTQADQGRKSPSGKQLEDQLKAYFQAKNQAIVDGDIGAMRRSMEKVVEGSLTDRVAEVVQRERTAAAKESFSYQKADTAVLVQQVSRQQGGRVIVLATEIATLWITSKGGPDRMAQRVVHQLTLAWEEERWLLVADEQIEKEGPQLLVPGATPKLGRTTTRP